MQTDPQCPPLSPEVQREIGRTAIAEEIARFRERGFDLTVSDEDSSFSSGEEFNRRLARDQ